MSFQFDTQYHGLPERFRAETLPTAVSNPQLITVNRPLAAALDIDADWLSSPTGVDILAGNQRPGGAIPVAMAYAGHQFGQFVPQLGDGRAVLLGEHLDQQGNLWDIQLKGSGPTPFSRNGDGRAWIGPVLREYLVGEAMHAMGVATTRALAAVTTGETVVRETALPGAVLTRVARSLVRVGSFEFFAARRDIDGTERLLDFVLQRLYPDLAEAENKALALLQRVVDQQAELIAHWMSLGFIHGVMNTDNMAISGETIDYGPCAFLDVYEPKKVFSAIDQRGRYAYGHQPGIGKWNLSVLAQCLVPLIDPDPDQAVALATQTLETYDARYTRAWLERHAAKLGVATPTDGDDELIDAWLEVLEANSLDFTAAFSALTRSLENTVQGQSPATPITAAAFMQATDLPLPPAWLERWLTRLQEPAEQTALASLERMRGSNPVVIPRNHQVERIIAEAVEQGSLVAFHDMLDAVTRPFDASLSESIWAQAPALEERVERTFCGT